METAPLLKPIGGVSPSPGREIRPRALRRRFLLVALLGLFVLARGQALSAAEPATSKEYQLKAGFLYNFSKFVQWPAGRFADERSDIVISVLGDDPFGGELDKVVKDRVVGGRAISIRRIVSADDIAGSHIVFVASDAEPLLGESIHGIPGVLTVGESPGFAARGGIITFIVVEEKVRFEINQGSAEKAGLKLSGQLLKLATAIRRAP